MIKITMCFIFVYYVSRYYQPPNGPRARMVPMIYLNFAIRTDPESIIAKCRARSLVSGHSFPWLT
jgi:hypothetical protein